MAGTGSAGRKIIVGQRRSNTVGRPRFRLGATPRTVRQPPANGFANIRVEGVEDTARQEVRRADVAIGRAYDEVLYDWFKIVERRWPVASGFSRGQLQVFAEQVDDTLVMRLQNLASYAAYIKQKWQSTPNVAKRLLWDPSNRLAERMIELSGDVLKG